MRGGGNYDYYTPGRPASLLVSRNSTVLLSIIVIPTIGHIACRCNASREERNRQPPYLVSIALIVTAAFMAELVGDHPALTKGVSNPSGQAVPDGGRGCASRPRGVG
jgi:hypothetical protein